MSKARDILRKGKQPSGNSWLSWLQEKSVVSFNVGLTWGHWAYMQARFVGWVVVTTGMITALPLIFEIKREIAVEEIEQMQISAGLAQGKTPHDLASSGLTAAIAPKVLK